ncbi:uncharacterized protein EV422DRAFT_515046 [Fimicolochytrium jonesii]|uniref:uncharacterized protein n=1 Tax=Fimicolochytrium jonesii TaxID=1396493 RepID=UPI0022FF03F4|nr:uncharacterized protein EV422DRAFT_515046 [Fimicolochytrium jonesii]KAI8826025.1 hypothetical protein EV422DRAFT_515046 [Fimicolochytrium jonesii]
MKMSRKESHQAKQMAIKSPRKRLALDDVAFCSLAVIYGLFIVTAPIALTLALSEATHAILHIKVLFGLGTQYTAKELESRRYYFISDLFSALLAFIVIKDQGLAPSSMWENVLAMLEAGHFLLHLVYITLWDSDCSLVKRIREWSAEPSLRC